MSGCWQVGPFAHAGCWKQSYLCEEDTCGMSFGRFDGIQVTGNCQTVAFAGRNNYDLSVWNDQDISSIQRRPLLVTPRFGNTRHVENRLLMSSRVFITASLCYCNSKEENAFVIVGRNRGAHYTCARQRWICWDWKNGVLMAWGELGIHANRNIKRVALALRQRETGPMLETLDYTILLSVSAVHRPYYISICISILPTQHTTLISLWDTRSWFQVRSLSWRLRSRLECG